MSKWKPRASSMGYYCQCMRRAALDKAIAEGLLKVSEVVLEAAPSPYADLGTCIHFEMQDGIRARFPSPAIDHAPTEDQYRSAATKFPTMEACRAQIRECATLAAHRLPELAPGVEWLAETEWGMRNEDPISGHIDLLSTDDEWIVDLKTTTRPPPAQRIKFAHYVQVHTYRLLTGRPIRRGMVLYVDSMSSKWVMPVTIDFTLPEQQEFAKNVQEHIEFINSPELYRAAVPQMGKHCHENWCPYQHICEEQFEAPRGELEKLETAYAKPTLFS